MPERAAEAGGTDAAPAVALLYLSEDAADGFEDHGLDGEDLLFEGLGFAFCRFRPADQVFFQGRDISLIGLGMVRGQTVKDFRCPGEIVRESVNKYQSQEIRPFITDRFFPKSIHLFKRHILVFA